MEPKFKVGDVVAAIVDETWIDDHPRGRPFTVTGSVYEEGQHPGILWVGGHILHHDGPVSGVTVTVLVSA